MLQINDGDVAPTLDLCDQTASLCTISHLHSILEPWPVAHYFRRFLGTFGEGHIDRRNKARFAHHGALTHATNDPRVDFKVKSARGLAREA
jgi:hypothetical protein